MRMDKSVASDSRLRKMKRRMPKEVWLVVVLLAVSAVIGVRNSVFLTPENFLDLLKGASVVGICALGMTFVALTGGIDVSVGAIVACVASTIGTFMFRVPGFNNAAVVVVVAVAVGAALGGINGGLIGKVKMPPIVATLATLAIFRGTLFLVTGGSWVNRQDLPAWLKSLSLATVAGIPFQVLVFAVLVIICWLVTRFTMFGRSVYAIGGSQTSAKRVGINVDRTLIYVYLFAGALYGVASLVHTTIMVGVDPNSFTGFEFKVIGAVFIGGIAIAGGRGNIFGAVIGVLLVAVISNGMVIARIPSFWQQVVTGLIILFAISFDVMQRRRIESRLVKIDVDE